jgi:hypothetical protein
MRRGRRELAGSETRIVSHLDSHSLALDQVRSINPRVNTLMTTTSCSRHIFVNTCDVDQDTIRHSKAQRLAHQCGVRAVKSRQPVSPDNVGHFKLVDNDSNRTIAGHKFDWTDEDVIDYCLDYLQKPNTPQGTSAAK